MLALTYGMMPSAKIDRFPSAPPLNMLKRPMRPAALLAHHGLHDVPVHARNRHEDADAVDREHPEREKDAFAQLRHLADVRKAGENAHLVARLARSRRSGRLRRGRGGRSCRPPWQSCRPRCARRRARDRDGLRQVAVAEDLDAVAPALDEAAVTERRLVDLGAGREDLEVSDVDGLREDAGTGC